MGKKKAITVSFHDGILVRDVAEILGIHQVSVRRLSLAGKLKPTKVGNTLVFERADIEAFKEHYNPAKGSGKISAKGESKQCRFPGCKKRADPKLFGYCREHYEQVDRAM